MLSEQIKLSLETFQPEKCFPPYLNTPRSLEACRRNGVNPVELVVIPYSEFQRDFPNDPDAAHRRYERIEAGRKRAYDAVLREWKKLVESKWIPPDQRTVVPKETILPVSPSVHCKLLEIQASKFRKIEQENWETLQRNLKIELMKADQEVRNSKIIQKQNDIQQQNEQLKRERKLQLEELERETLQRKFAAEREEQQRIKEEQMKYAEQEMYAYEQRIRARHNEKLSFEKKEEERVARQQYTQQLKDSIVTRIDTQLHERKKASEVKEKYNEDRVQRLMSYKSREREQRKLELEQRIEQVQQERAKRDKQSRDDVSKIFIITIIII
jgi:hypothetical protein